MTSAALEPAYMDEDYRPQFHYTAEKNMINDPNGLVYLDGEFHLFHQYNLHEAIHWGHAISTDLVHWKHLPPAIAPDFNGQVYSGTAVVDQQNSSGLQVGDVPVIVAAFTHAGHEDGTQSQGLAYSTDRGRSWTMHPDNPVLPNPGQKDFRDPKILWHEPTRRWVMVVTAGTHLEFYSSSNLTQWKFESSWGKGQGSHAGVWECPDLFQLQVNGEREARWVVSVSVDRGAPAGGSGMQYFIGDFDGTRFTNEYPQETLWQNWGKDFYAGITWSNVPASDGRTLMIAWLDNWLYRFDPPTTPFNGQLTLVRELTLKRTEDGLRLIQLPVREQDQLRGAPTVLEGRTIPGGGENLDNVQGDALELLVEFDLEETTAIEFGVDVRVGDGEYTRVGYSVADSRAYIDRVRSGVVPSEHWAGRHDVPATSDGGRVRFRIFVDRSSVEVFVNEREQLSDLILPQRKSRGVRMVALGGDAKLVRLEAFPVKRIWASERRPIWSVCSGEWANTTLGRQGSAASGQLGLSLWPTPIEDGSVETILRFVGATAGNPQRILGERYAGVAVRYDADCSAGYLVRLDRESGEIQLVCRADSETVIARAAVDVRTNRAYLLRASAYGLEFTVEIDDVEVLRVTDASYRFGHFGVMVQDAEVVFNDIRVEDRARLRVG